MSDRSFVTLCESTHRHSRVWLLGRTALALEALKIHDRQVEPHTLSILISVGWASTGFDDLKPPLLHVVKTIGAGRRLSFRIKVPTKSIFGHLGGKGDGKATVSAGPEIAGTLFSWDISRHLGGALNTRPFVPDKPQ